MTIVVLRGEWESIVVLDSDETFVDGEAIVSVKQQNLI
jgi:hypothetical protein